MLLTVRSTQRLPSWSTVGTSGDGSFIPFSLGFHLKHSYNTWAALCPYPLAATAVELVTLGAP